VQTLAISMPLAENSLLYATRWMDSLLPVVVAEDLLKTAEAP
jgi:hypothetical protein